MSDSEIEVSDEFIGIVKACSNLDKVIEERKTELKKLVIERKDFDEYILDYLEEIGETQVGITGGFLVVSKTKTKKSVKNNKMIEILIKDGGKNEEEANELVNKFNDEREVVERRTLKRKKTKITKSINI